MKPTTKMSRTIQALETIYRSINADLFDNKLPDPIITVQRTPGSYGHSSVRKIWESNGTPRYELNIDTQTLNLPIEETLDTMIHEAIHIFCRESDIKETSRNGYYHNATFKELAEEKHLVTINTGKYGWNTIAKGNDWLTEYALSRGFDDFKINEHAARSTFISTGTSTNSGNSSTTNGEKKQSNSRKYQCPMCGISVRATKDVFILCGDCKATMKKV